MKAREGKKLVQDPQQVNGRARSRIQAFHPLLHSSFFLVFLIGPQVAHSPYFQCQRLYITAAPPHPGTESSAPPAGKTPGPSDFSVPHSEGWDPFTHLSFTCHFLSSSGSLKQFLGLETFWNSLPVHSRFCLSLGCSPSTRAGVYPLLYRLKTSPGLDDTWAMLFPPLPRNSGCRSLGLSSYPARAHHTPLGAVCQPGPFPEHLPDKLLLHLENETSTIFPHRRGRPDAPHGLLR